MKLISGAALLAATASAQNINDLVAEFVNKIYQVDATGKIHNFNIEPYFVAEYECLGNGIKSNGYYGNGNGKIQYSEEALWTDDSASYKLVTSGKVSSAPLALVIEIPEDVSNDAFDETLEFNLGMDGIQAKMEGTIGAGQYSGNFNLGVGSVQATAKKFSVGASLNREMTHSNVHPYWAAMLPPHGSTHVTMNASMKKACSENPLDKSCTAKIAVKGDHNDESIGNTVAKYSVQKKRASVIVSQDGAEMVSVSLVGIDTMEVLALKYKLAGKPGVLVVQAVGPVGVEQLMAAASDFAGPFIHFFSKIDFNSAHSPAHVIAYFDKVMKHVVGKNYFNVYPVIEASKFESNLLAEAMGASSVQSALSEYATTANTMIEQACSENHQYVSEARAFIQEVVSAAGESSFDTWFADVTM